MKRLLLLGGGHAHLRVLAEIARQPLDGWQVCMVTPHERQIYSGMLPGWVAGLYTLDQCTIPLAPLAARAGCELHLDAAQGLDAQRQVVFTAGGATIDYDALSLDIGAAPNIRSLAGAREHGVPIRPIESFVAQFPALVARLRAARERFDLTVLGSGAAGLELAFALRHRAQMEGWPHLQVHLAGAEDLPLAGAPARASRMALEGMRQRAIHWHPHRRAVGLDAAHVRFDDGTTLATDACWMVTGAAAPGWLADTALAKDPAGFVRVDASLRSLSHPNVFAAGDVASHASPLPKSGVYAVRAGQWLARNLIAHCNGQPLGDWQPQARTLYLISTGDRHAMGVWGGWVWQGRWVWRWKDAIDRRFVRSHAPGR